MDISAIWINILVNPAEKLDSQIKSLQIFLERRKTTFIAVEDANEPISNTQTGARLIAF